MTVEMPSPGLNAKKKAQFTKTHEHFDAVIKPGRRGPE